MPAFPGMGTRLSWPFQDPATFEGSEEERLAKFRASCAMASSGSSAHGLESFGLRTGRCERAESGTRPARDAFNLTAISCFPHGPLIVPTYDQLEPVRAESCARGERRKAGV